MLYLATVSTDYLLGVCSCFGSSPGLAATSSATRVRIDGVISFGFFLKQKVHATSPTDMDTTATNCSTTLKLKWLSEKSENASMFMLLWCFFRIVHRMVCCGTANISSRWCQLIETLIGLGV